MSQDEKLYRKFFNTPEALHLREIEKVLHHLGWIKIPAKGSHIKWKHPFLQSDLIIPVHHNDCKSFYKKLARKVSLPLV